MDLLREKSLRRDDLNLIRGVLFAESGVPPELRLELLDGVDHVLGRHGLPRCGSNSFSETSIFFVST